MTGTDPGRAAAECLRGASRVVVLTGAGMSAESGVPTFRDSLTGLWARFDPQRLATPEAFLADPATVFGWYLSRIKTIGLVQPHAGYHALVRLQDFFDEFCVVTQNVDGLHTRAGSCVVYELHGSLSQSRCFHQGHPYPQELLVEMANGAGTAAVAPPECETCGSAIRPGVVWFGEPLPGGVMEAAMAVVTRADVVLVVGTSSVVYPAAQLPVEAKRAGASVIEINPGRTPFSSQADVYWNETAGRALSQLANSLDPSRKEI